MNPFYIVNSVDAIEGELKKIDELDSFLAPLSFRPPIEIVCKNGVKHIGPCDCRRYDDE